MVNVRTLVYRYGLLPPVAGANDVSAQLRAANDYYNALIEIERDRRAAEQEVLMQHAPLADAAENVAALEEEIGGTNGNRERVRELRAELKEARKIWRAALRDAKRVHARQLAVIREEVNDRRKAERAACGLYWGTYLRVEQDAQVASRGAGEPHFRRFDGTGRVAVQIQRGMTIPDLTGCGDTRARLDLRPQTVPGRGGQDRPRLRVRIGSDGREAVWAEWPIVYHRPLPQSASIKWIDVALNRTASDERWSAHVTIELPADWTCEDHGTGAVAVDLRWRAVTHDEHTDTLLAAQLIDQRGKLADYEIEPEVAGGVRKADDLRSIRDRHMNRARRRVVRWFRAVQLREGITVPAEHIERTETLAHWRASPRLAGLILWWRDHRFACDDRVYSYLEHWRRRDKHIWQWESHARRKAAYRRRDGYRVLAAQLARQYGTLIVEDTDLATMRRGRRGDTPADTRARWQAGVVAPGELRKTLVHAFHARGGTVIEVGAGDGPADLWAAFERGDGEEIPAPTRQRGIGRFRRSAGDVEGEKNSPGTAARKSSRK